MQCIDLVVEGHCEITGGGWYEVWYKCTVVLIHVIHGLHWPSANLHCLDVLLYAVEIKTSLQLWYALCNSGQLERQKHNIHPPCWLSHCYKITILIWITSSYNVTVFYSFYSFYKYINTAYLFQVWNSFLCFQTKQDHIPRNTTNKGFEHQVVCILTKH